jgi:hypothetical protein
MNRDREYYREMREKHIKRKKRISHQGRDYWYYKFDGQYSKGKIHCSCPLCSVKSSEELKHSDKIKIDEMISQLKDL